MNFCFMHIAVIVTVVAPLMAWVVMPALTRSASRWLYPTR
jgi:antibiotic biosynthesis monooxygenase (ABM) superfamily enzyme